MNFDRRGTSDGWFDLYNPDAPGTHENKYYKIEVGWSRTVFLQTSRWDLDESTICENEEVITRVQELLDFQNMLCAGESIYIQDVSETSKPLSGKMVII